MAKILLDWLIEHYPAAKRQTLKRMVQAGRVTVNGKRAVALKQALDEAAAVAVDAPAGPLPAARAARPAHLRIVHEDADIIVLDKPVGLLASTVPREPRATLLAMVREYVESKDRQAHVGLIHRLDRDASGILIFSKNHPAYQSLKAQFFEHTVRREYTAVVHGVPAPASGTIESNLVERADGTVYGTKQIGKGQVAVSRYEVVRSAGGRSLVRVVLETGRKHQIRVHLSERGCPIVGDKVYGKTDSATRLMLAATKLTIHHPRDGKEMTFEVRSPVSLSGGAVEKVEKKNLPHQARRGAQPTPRKKPRASASAKETHRARGGGK